jgi:hypothetical protein
MKQTTYLATLPNHNLKANECQENAGVDLKLKTVRRCVESDDPEVEAEFPGQSPS